ncbi:MAG TPA: M20/M25/M40 family metallo-hydrolase [Candidatus Krumholzibacteria bacterium]|nr:M20/M25/M40 family metallo-hydrolase [Candidatus Krumholzibacteria bacterium]
MRRCILAVSVLLAAVPVLAASAPPAPDLAADVARITAAAQADDHAMARMIELCDEIGPRLNGSPAMARAIDWAVAHLRADGADDARREPVLVPHWVRGAERARVLAPWSMPLPVIGLGGTVGTPPGGLEADVLVVESFEELEARRAEAAGRIVLFNMPWEGYGKTVQYRTKGADAAARHGAVGCLIRSVTQSWSSPPHTGIMRYAGGDTIPRIPAAAIPVRDAARMARQQARGLPVRVRLELEAEMLPNIEQGNVVADLRGREKPEEIVLVSGHFDSWDAGCGIHDDGAACVIAMEVLRQLAALDMRPRRTVRVVLWADEEMTQTGSKAYVEAHADELEKHVAAIESDSGCFAPAGWSVRGDSLTVAAVAELAAHLEPLGASAVSEGWAGVDVRALNELGVPGVGHRVHNDDYFLYHHSPDDTVDKIDPDHVKANVAALTAMVWMLAEREDPLPRPAVDRP